jgi:hypothetical protein
MSTPRNVSVGKELLLILRLFIVNAQEMDFVLSA